MASTDFLGDQKKYNKKDEYPLLVLKWGWFLFLFCLFLMSEPWRDSGCHFNEHSIFKEEFAGKVKQKYIDYPNHASETVEFYNNNKISLIWGSYYAIIQEGDSISKEKNSFILQVFKQDTTLELAYKMVCNEEGEFYYNPEKKPKF